VVQTVVERVHIVPPGIGPAIPRQDSSTRWRWPPDNAIALSAASVL